MRFGSLCLLTMLSAVVALHAAAPRSPLGLDLYRPVPEDNPLTPEKIALGRQLFHERRLSRDGSLACASCHDPQRAFTDGRSRARGIGGAIGDRNAPAIINRAWGTSFFWDGRAPTLEQQALQPILSPSELGMSPTAVVALARSDRYRARFLAAFGTEPVLEDVGRALASYVRTIVAADSPYDRYAAGNRRALSDQARRIPPTSAAPRSRQRTSTGAPSRPRPCVKLDAPDRTCTTEASRASKT